ncbi:hypothetical protein WJX73_009911 [Symbiochloris irregularis]|uniref:Uncharacterized protein n=1 Tax=Symbiochloris irregularis TaxID=706552 RepID=A0AAW1NP06_9CHLO
MAGYAPLDTCNSQLEEFSDVEEDHAFITDREVARGGDLQGIPWDRLHFNRTRYRATRLAQYPNYLNLEDEVKASAARIEAESLKVDKGHQFYDFCRNAKKVRTSIVHFQLRNLVWASSKHDVYFIHNNCLKHWSAVTNQMTKVLDASGLSPPATEDRLTAAGRMQISTCCVQGPMCALGGFSGELVVRNLDLGRGEDRAVQSTRLTESENGITNGIEMFEGRSGASCVMSSNNDALVRVLDTATFQTLSKWELPWAVNWSTIRPTDRGLVACVGDHPHTLLLDANSGAVAHTLDGHVDYSFAAAWHPGGNLLATGNQDTTMCIWDMRQLSKPQALLKGSMAAVRSIRFSADGRYCAAAEAGDFVHILDVASGFRKCQEIDLFGEVAGVAFSPDASTMFIGIADVTYSSMLQYNHHKLRRKPERVGDLDIDDYHGDMM